MKLGILIGILLCALGYGLTIVIPNALTAWNWGSFMVGAIFGLIAAVPVGYIFIGVLLYSGD